MNPLFPEAGSYFHSEGLSAAVVPSYDPEGWKKQGSLLDIAGVQLALGWHPWCLPGHEFEEVRDRMDQAFAHLTSEWKDRLVAVGEFGLDRARPEFKECFELQVQVFRHHLTWAKRLNLPVILHSVRALGKTLELLKQDPPTKGGVLHSYSGPPDMIDAFAEVGMYFGFSPALADSEKQSQSLQKAPTERILFESDLPGGEKKHNPAEALRQVVRLAAKILDKSEEWCWSVQRENCKRLFLIGP